MGAICLKYIVNQERRGKLGITELNGDIKDVQGIGLEISITFVLGMTVFAVTDKSRKDVGHGMAPIAVSFAILATLLTAVGIVLISFFYLRYTKYINNYVEYLHF